MYRKLYNELQEKLINSAEVVESHRFPKEARKSQFICHLRSMYYIFYRVDV